MKYQGRCHCGEVRFEVEMSLESVVSCNCSICSTRGYLLGFAPETNFTLLSGEKTLNEYQFGKKRIRHYFCSKCGSAPFGKGVARDGTASRAINVRYLEGIDLDKITPTKFDGKSLPMD